MSNLLAECCCDGVVSGECCSTAWGAAQSDDFSFTPSGNVVTSGRRQQWNSCTENGVTDYRRAGASTNQTTYTFSNVELKRRTGQGGQQQKWSFYNGTISITNIVRSYRFGAFNCETDLDCDRGYTLTVEVVATNGTYSNTVTFSCNQDASATISWSGEPSDWTDNWFMIQQQCQTSDETYCQADGDPVTIQRRQFRIQTPSIPSVSPSVCPDCYQEVLQFSPSWNANNPDCDSNDLEDLTWYPYGTASTNYCDGGEGSNGSVCSADQNNRGDDVFDLSYPAVTNSVGGSCIERGLIMPSITIAAI
jgi:hypothetical protein